MKNKILFLTIAVIVVAIAGISSYLLLSEEKIKYKPTPPPAQPTKKLLLSDYPELFKENTIIVIGENASQIEKDCAESIAENIENLTGYKASIKNDIELISNDNFKKEFNIIIVGTPQSNKILGKVYNMTDVTKVTKDYPGEGKGILEIVKNPWNKSKAMLLVEGSDEWGVKAGSEILQYVKELEKEKVVVNWEHFTENKQAVALGLTPSEFETLSASVHEYLYEKYPFLRDTEFGIRYEKVDAKVEGIPPESLVIDAYANFRTPPVVIRVVFYDGNAKVISEKVIEETGDIKTLDLHRTIEKTIQIQQTEEHRDVEIDEDPNPEFIIHWRYGDFPNNDRTDEVVDMVETAARISWNTIIDQWGFDEPPDDDGGIDIYINKKLGDPVPHFFYL